MPVGGTLPLAHTGDQLRRVVPDGREDISLAALFEIGRLLALNKPSLIAAMMQWRGELFGAARARELAEELSARRARRRRPRRGRRPRRPRGPGAHAPRRGLHRRCRPTRSGRARPRSRSPRVPEELGGLSGRQVITGSAAIRRSSRQVGKQFGVDGLAAVPVPTAEAPQVRVGRQAGAGRAHGPARTARGRPRDQRARRSSRSAAQPPQGHARSVDRRGDLARAREEGGATEMDCRPASTSTRSTPRCSRSRARSPRSRATRASRTASHPTASCRPRSCASWRTLRLLEGVPFSHLVPDAELIPPETIRFFYLDRNATDALDAGRAERRHGQRRRPRAARAAVPDRARRGRPGRAPGADEGRRRPQGRRRRAGRSARAARSAASSCARGWCRAGRACTFAPTPPTPAPTTRRSPTWTPAPTACGCCGWSASPPPCCFVLFDGVPAVVHIEEPRCGHPVRRPPGPAGRPRAADGGRDGAQRQGPQQGAAQGRQQGPHRPGALPRRLARRHQHEEAQRGAARGPRSQHGQPGAAGAVRHADAALPAAPGLRRHLASPRTPTRSSRR